MLRIFFLLLVLGLNGYRVKTQEIPTTSMATEPDTPNDSEDAPPNESPPVPEIILDTESGTNIGHDTKVGDKISYKPLPPDFLHKLSTLHRWKPVQEKLDRLKQYLAFTKHPNYGGVQFLSPQDIWERLHEKGHHLLTGINGAVFGLANVENPDYPFAYRQLESMTKN